MITKCSDCGGANDLKKSNRCAYCRLYLLSKLLLEQNRLSQEAWRKFQMALHLPLEKAESDVKNTRYARQLLEYFVARSSLAQSNNISVEDIKNWITDYGDKAILPIQTNTKSINQIGVTADLQKTSNKVKHSSEKKKRKSVSQKRYSEVAVRQGSFCYWCGIKVVRESQIPVNKRLMKNKTSIIYLCGEDIREDAIGTIDHIIRIADGGNNSLTNLVISCVSCNLERDKYAKAYNRPFSRKRVICNNCGGNFFHPAWGCCSICGAIPQPISNLGQLLKLLKDSIKKCGIYQPVLFCF